MNTSYKDQLNLIRLIHFALMAGIGLFLLVVVFLIIGEKTSTSELALLNYISPGFFVVILILQGQMFKLSLKPALKPDIPLSSKLATFQTAHIIRMALLEGCGLFAAVSALLNAELLHLITVALVLGFMFTKTPTVLMLESVFGLSREEKDQLLQ